MKVIFTVFFLCCVLTGCGNSPSGSFKIKLPEDLKLKTSVQAVLPAILNVCPGLNKYSNDFSTAEVGETIMRGYEGGIHLAFKVADSPQLLPSSIRTKSMGHNCYIDVKPDGSMIYIAKTACHSICDGTPHNNNPNSLGREFALR